MKFPDFEPIGCARSYAELQPLLRELADTCGWSRQEIDRRGGLPDNYSSKALAPVPIGTTDNPSAKLLAKLLKGVGGVLVVARVHPKLDRVADLGVKRREDRVHAKLLSRDVFVAAARRNGKIGGKARCKKMTSKRRQSIATRAARIRWQATPKAERRRFGALAANARWDKVHKRMLASQSLMMQVQI